MQQVPIDFPFVVKTLGGYLYIFQDNTGTIRGEFYEPEELNSLCAEEVNIERGYN